MTTRGMPIETLDVSEVARLSMRRSGLRGRFSARFRHSTPLLYMVMDRGE
jgi:hypothetical protein